MLNFEVAPRDLPVMKSLSLTESFYPCLIRVSSVAYEILYGFYKIMTSALRCLGNLC
jgi:hypothetical protein